jgi:hypothetical protein
MPIDRQRFERLCREQAERCTLELSRHALRILANNYRLAADELAAVARQSICQHSAHTGPHRIKLRIQEVIDFAGSPGWIRTSDHSINSRMLYR